MFDFYVACVQTHSVAKNCFFWRPIKIFTSRSSCIRFFKSYEPKTFEFKHFGIVHITQDLVHETTFKEVFYGKD